MRTIRVTEHLAMRMRTWLQDVGIVEPQDAVTVSDLEDLLVAPQTRQLNGYVTEIDHGAPEPLWKVQCPMAPAHLRVHWLTKRQMGPARLDRLHLSVALEYHIGGGYGKWTVTREIKS